MKLSEGGEFVITTDRNEFELNVDHLGAYTLDGDLITMTAGPDSRKCSGISAMFRATLYEDGTLRFEDVDVPCATWLEMGSEPGEGEIWIRLAE
jgi:hypothetical protein